LTTRKPEVTPRLRLQPVASRHPKTKHLLRLNALRVFDVAARHLNFKDAAAELGVTNSAVSIQIKNIEEALGAKLFGRHGHQMTLTPEGKRYFASIHAGLRIIADATSEFSKAVADHSN